MLRFGWSDPAARAGLPLPQQVEVRMLDRHGEEVGNVQVEFAVTADGGSVAPASVSTDGSGYACASWTLDTAAGENRLEARVPGLAARPRGRLPQDDSS